MGESVKPQPENNGEKVGRQKIQGGSERDPRMPLFIRLSPPTNEAAEQKTFCNK